MKKVATAAALACASVATAGTTTGGSLIPRHSVLLSGSGSVRQRPPLLSSVRGGAQHQDDGSNADEHPPPPPSGSKDDAPAAKSFKKKKKKKRPKKKQEEETSTTQPKEEETISPQETLLKELLQTDDYYEILGVNKSVTVQQIKKAYRRRAVQTHPDKTDGDRRAFDKVAEAYDVLSDEQKRSIYDRLGKRGLEHSQHPSSHGAAGAAEELFRSFFGNSFRSSSSSSAAPRNQTMRYQLEVSLEDLYWGRTRTVLVARKHVQVHVPRGMASGQSIWLSGERMNHMDTSTTTTPAADLMFTLAQRPHPVFTRRGHDLAMELTISLQEAVCGVTRTIRHLDGRSVVFKSAQDRHHDHDDVPVIIQTGNVQVLKGEGMPKPSSSKGHGDEHDDKSDYGDLYVQFVVEMPSPQAMKRLSSEEREELELLLAKLEGASNKDDNKKDNKEDVVYLEKATTRDFGRASGHFRMEQDEIPAEEEQASSFPFGDGRHFYWSSSPGKRGPFPFGGRSAGAGAGLNDDDSNVQCRQM